MQSIRILRCKALHLSYGRIFFENNLPLAVGVYLERVALAYSHGSSYFFWNNDSSEVVDTTDYSRGFHIYKNLLDLQICDVSICKTRKLILVF